MLPESKRFPLDFVVAEPGETGRLTRTALAELEEEPVVRVAKGRGWAVAVGEGRWAVEVPVATGVKRVDVQRTGAAAGGGILRFVSTGESGVPAERYVELLRRNAQMAHAGLGLGLPGEPGRLVTSATLLEDTADEEEIVAALEAVARGGEPIAAARLESFDRSGYKLSPPSSEPGSWEDEILRRALGGTGIAFERSGARADCLVRLDGGRTQKVYLFFDRADSTGRQLVQLLSVCGPGNPTHHGMALASNPTLSFATIALAAIGGEENLVVVRTQLASTADPEEILVAVTTLGRIGDRIEAQVSGGEDRR